MFSDQVPGIIGFCSLLPLCQLSASQSLSGRSFCKYTQDRTTTYVLESSKLGVRESNESELTQLGNCQC